MQSTLNFFSLLSNAITLYMQKYSLKIDGIILVIVHSEGYLTNIRRDQINSSSK